MVLLFHIVSSDSATRVLIATIRNLGKCPCVRCLVTKDEIHQLGLVRDFQVRTERLRLDDSHRQREVQQARKALYSGKCGVGSKAIEDLLAKKSQVPTQVRSRSEFQLCR